MNGNDYIYTKDHVFVNRGWSGLRCAKECEYDKSYRTYDKIIPQDDDGAMYAGDISVLKNSKIIAIFEGVRVVLDTPWRYVILLVTSIFNAFLVLLLRVLAI